MSWGTISEERIAEADALIGVPLRRDRMQWIETATRDAIRHFAWGIGDNNPLWTDKDYAARSTWGKIVAPPCLLYAVDNTVVAPKLSGVQWIYAGTSWTWYEPIFIDDSFRVEAMLVKQEEKSGRRFAKWVLQTGEIRFYNQHDRLVAVARGRCARTPRGDKLTASKGASAIEDKEPHRYTTEEIQAIESEILAEPRTGAKTLYWEDISIGQSVPPVVRGPLSIIDIMAWYSAQQGAQPYGGVHGDALRYRQRHQDYHINETTGARESAGRGHLEARTGGDVGMGGAYDIGPQRISWAQHMLTNWIGDNGFLHMLDIAVLRPNVVGDTVWWRGTVTGKTSDSNGHAVQIELNATNQKGDLSAKGSATVLLPSRSDGAVRLPVPRPTAVSGDGGPDG
jgi:acyl dehydratase